MHAHHPQLLDTRQDSLEAACEQLAAAAALQQLILLLLIPPGAVRMLKLHSIGRGIHTEVHSQHPCSSPASIALPVPHPAQQWARWWGLEVLVAGSSGVCSTPGVIAAASLLASWSWCQTLYSMASCKIDCGEIGVHAALPQD